MFPCSSHAYRQRRGSFFPVAMQLCAVCVMIGLSALVGTGRSDAQDNVPPSKINLTSAKPYYFLTNAVQFRELSGPGDFAKCAFQLTGVVTLVDTNRNL